MATVASKMTALANEVREISGATNKLSIDAMTMHLDTVNAEIVEQESLIADMNEMLDNLGAESVGGSSGGSMETCTVTVTNQDFTMPLVIYTTVENSTIKTKAMQNVAAGTMSISCLKGTRMFLSENRAAISGGLMIMNTSGGVSYEGYAQLSTMYSLITFVINDDGTINMEDDT